MRRLATLAVAVALMSPTTASGQDCAFGDWARYHGYSPGDAMPSEVWAYGAGIDSFDGMDEFDWTTTPTTKLVLTNNRLLSIESGDFSGLTNLRTLDLNDNGTSCIESGDFSGLTNLTYLGLKNNQLSSVESGAFSEMTNLTTLQLGHNVALTELNLAESGFSSLATFDVGGSVNITSVSLRNTVLNQTSLAALLDGGEPFPSVTGIGELDGIAEVDLSGIDFVAITALDPLYVMDDLTDLWMANTQNVDATQLDVLLDNLQTIEGADTEGILYMTQADFDAFNTAGGDLLAAWHGEPGHHVEYLAIGDVNHDTDVNGLDVDPFVDVLLASRFDVAADMNGDGVVNGLDVDPFVATVVGGSQSVPEPSALLLCVVALVGLRGLAVKRSRVAGDASSAATGNTFSVARQAA